MRLRFDETTLTKNPMNPISTDVTPTAPPSVANYLDLCHLPAGCLPWLFTRTMSQVNAAAMVGKVAYDAGFPVSDAALLRVDHNVLVLIFGSGVKLAVYPDGSLGHEGQVLDGTPAAVQSLIGQEAPEMPATGMQVDPAGIDTVGMINVAGGPEMDPEMAPADEAVGDASVGDIGDPVEMSEPMISSEFYGDSIDGKSPVDAIMKQIGAIDGPPDLPLALVDDKGSPTKGERRKR